MLAVGFEPTRLAPTECESAAFTSFATPAPFRQRAVITRGQDAPLFVSPDLLRSDLISYAVSPDGQRILYPAPNPDAPAREIHVVLNWFEELKAKGGRE